MNLYIITQVLSDCTSGMAVIAAESQEHCRELFASEFSFHLNEYDAFAEFVVIENVNHSAGVVSYVYGGA